MSQILTSAILCNQICTRDFVSTVPKGYLGQLSEFPQLRRSQGQCQNHCTLWAHTTGDRWQSALPDGQLLRRSTQWLLSQQTYSSPTYLTLQFRNRSECVYSKTGEQALTPTGTWQPQSEEKDPQCPAQALTTPSQLHPLLRKGKHILKKDMAGIHTKHPSQQKC